MILQMWESKTISKPVVHSLIKDKEKLASKIKENNLKIAKPTVDWELIMKGYIANQVNSDNLKIMSTNNLGNSANTQD